MEWKAYVWEIVAAAVIIPFIGFVSLQLRNWLNTAKEHISLQIPATLEEQKFGLLHVRNGKDEVADHSPLLNKEKWFANVGPQTTQIVTVRYKKNLGFQYKCFVDYANLSFERLRAELEDTGYKSITPWEGKRGRAGFIHPRDPVCETIDGYTNNFCPPK